MFFKKKCKIFITVKTFIMPLLMQILYNLLIYLYYHYHHRKYYLLILQLVSIFYLNFSKILTRIKHID